MGLCYQHVGGVDEVTCRQALDRGHWSQDKRQCRRGILERYEGDFPGTQTLSQLVSEIDADRNQGNLSSAIRQFVLEHFKSRAVRLTGEPRPRASHAQGLAESSLETR